MREWTYAERYRTLEERNPGELESMHEAIKKSIWRADFHVKAFIGLMGDTNGFSYFNGRWHLFYQWFPYGPVHGVKYWYHVSSEDLIHWRNEGNGLSPDTFYDNKGVFSGCGFPKGDTLYLPYTGNRRDENWIRFPFQMLAMMDKDGNITKQDEPLYGQVEGFTEHQRDPKMFYRKEDDSYYFIIGAQTNEKKGKFLIFRSKDIRKDWKLLGEMKIRGYDDFGYMVECPDLERVGDKWLLLFSPQGLPSQGDQFRNVYDNVYFIGDMDFDNLEFIPDGPYKELDRGFDFYAAQCAGQELYTDRAILCAWFGISDYHYPPEVEEGYTGIQVLPRVLTIENGELKQRPIDGWEKLKEKLVYKASKGSVSLDETNGKSPGPCIMEFKNHDNGPISMDIFGRGENKGFTLDYDPATSYLSIDKGNLDNRMNEDFGNDRRVRLENGLEDLLIFVDRSSIEIYVNDGSYTLSIRVFPFKDEDSLRIDAPSADIEIHTVGCVIEDNFVI